MASRKNDPFNFDDIYRQAGVEDLFVKKTMGEQKQAKQASPAPVAAPGTSRTTPSANRPVPVASSFDLDFLSSFAAPSGGGTPSNLSKHGSSASLVAAASPQLNVQQQQPLRQAQPSSSLLDDPFALFQEVPGAAPVQQHIPEPVAAPASRSGTGNLLDFDDGLAFPAAMPAPVAAAPAPVTSPAPTSAPGFSTARAPSLQAPRQSQPTAQPQPSPQPPAPVAAQSPPPPPTPVAPASPPPPPPPAYEEHDAHHPAPSGPSPQPLGSAPAASGFPSQSPYSRGRGDRDAERNTDYPYSQRPSQHHPSRNAHGATSHTASASSSVWSGHGAQAPHGSLEGGAGAGAGGISGYLKAFGKKAVKVAKQGLAQLEHALEGLDGQQQQQQQQQHSGSAAHGQSWSRGGRSQEDVAVSHDEALAWAVRLADLTPHAQQQELAQMSPPLRRKVIEVLREQVRVEYEAAHNGGSGAAPPHHVSGSGHGAALDASPGAPPPGYGHGGHGHGAPVSPPSTGPQPSPRGGVQGHIGQERPAAETRPPVAPAAAPPSPAPPVEHHDLLGMGGVAPAARPAAAAPPPPPATARPPASPVMDDLLGFGSDGPATAAAAAPAPAAASPQPVHSPAASVTARAPPPPPPAAVHVDDMDDFFSGGRGSGSTAAPAAAAAAAAGGAASRAASGAMHASSSSASLGPRGGGGGSSAAMADFLHDDGDALGGLGKGADVNVDVSGYADLYRGEQGDANEPEIRKQLRAQREAAKHAKMKAALAEKLALEAEEAARREQQVTLKETYKANIEVWKNRNKGNIRGLLGSLHTVLWPDSGWAPVSVGDLLEPAQIKKVYMRANLLVHPDKVRQRNGSAEQVAIADMVFDVLKEAWNAFR